MPRHLPSLLVLFVSVPGWTASAQEPGKPTVPTPAAPPAAAVPAPAAASASTVPDDLRTLAERVDLAHRPEGPVPPVTALRVDLTLHVHDPAAEQRGQVDLAVQFLLWRREGKKEQPLLRYEVRDAGKPIVRGRDSFGPWQLVQGKPKDLDGAEFATDLAQLQRHVSLAHQLVRCLAPGDVLRGLREPGAVRDEALVFARGKPPIPCRVATGRTSSFPLLQKAGDAAEAQLLVYVHAEKGTLVAIDALPITDGKPDTTRGERVWLLDQRLRDGLLVPHELVHLFRDDKGELRPQSRVVLQRVQLRPELRAEDFDRDR